MLILCFIKCATWLVYFQNVPTDTLFPTMSLTEAEQLKTNIVTLQNGQTLTAKSDTGKKLDSLPVIDVSGMYSENFEERKAVAEQVRAAAHDIGFFYAINHVCDLTFHGYGQSSQEVRASIQNILHGLLRKPRISLLNQWRRKWKSTPDWSRTNM
jgi:hypothetical protein